MQAYVYKFFKSDICLANYSGYFCYFKLNRYTVLLYLVYMHICEKVSTKKTNKSNNYHQSVDIYEKPKYLYRSFISLVGLNP